MKIDGIDSLLLNRLKDQQSSRTTVREVERVQPENRSGSREKVPGRKPVSLESGTFWNQLEEGVNKLNDTVEAFNITLRFMLHQEADRWVVQLIDVKDNQVVRQIPPEQVLNVVAQIQNLIGILLDERR